MKKLTSDDFIRKSIEVHGDTYDYSSVEYNGNKSYVEIYCKKHGIFSQRAANHLLGSGCRKCQAENASMRMTSSKDDFIKKSLIIHGNKYNYDKSIYINNSCKLIITCRIHGDFCKSPDKHLIGQGCQKCSGKGRLQNDDFVKKSKEIHNNKYDYTKTKCKKVSEKITVTCLFHGDFIITPSNHLKGRGCPSCAKTGFDPSKTSYVYFLHGNGLIKVGITKSTKQRISKLKSATHFDFNLIAKIKTTGTEAMRIEKYYHKKYESAGLTGFDGATEWLKYSPELMSEIMNERG